MPDEIHLDDDELADASENVMHIAKEQAERDRAAKEAKERQQEKPNQED